MDQCSRSVPEASSAPGSSQPLLFWQWGCTCRRDCRDDSRVREHRFPSTIIIMAHLQHLQQKGAHSIALRPITDRQDPAPLCFCQLCSAFETNKLRGLLAKQEESFEAELMARSQAHFPPSHLKTILKYLLLPTNKIVRRGVEIFVPEVCFFQEGEATQLYYTRDLDDYHLVLLKKEKITYQHISKMFNERRRHYRESIKKALKLDIEVHREISKLSMKMGRRNGSQSKGRSLDLNCVILRFTDGCETLLTETDFFHVMHRRKYDPFWRRVYSVRNYIHPYAANADDKYIFTLDYHHEIITHPELHARAQQLMATYSQREPPGTQKYISDSEQSNFCLQLQKSSLLKLVHYVLYKMAAFISTFADEQILSGKFTFIVNEVGRCYLLEVPELAMRPLLKYDWTNEKYQEMTARREYDRYHRKELRLTAETVEQSAKIEALMGGEYDHLKKELGVTVQPKEDENERLNNEFFQAIHPELHMELSQLVKLDLPLSQVRRRFLGEQQQRRALVRPFNSRIVRELHKLTPLTRKSLGPSPSPASTQREEASTWRGRRAVDLRNTISH